MDPVQCGVSNERADQLCEYELDSFLPNRYVQSSRAESELAIAIFQRSVSGPSCRWRHSFRQVNPPAVVIMPGIAHYLHARKMFGYVLPQLPLSEPNACQRAARR